MSNYKNEIRENVIRTYKALVDETYAPKVVEPVITVENMAAIADAAEQGGGGGGTSVQEFDGEYRLNVSALLEKIGDNKDLMAANAKILLGTTYNDSQSEAAGATDYIYFTAASGSDSAMIMVSFNNEEHAILTNVTAPNASIATVLAGVNQEANIVELIGNIVPLFSFRSDQGIFEPEYSTYNIEDLFTPANDDTTEEETPVAPIPVPGL